MQSLIGICPKCSSNPLIQMNNDYTIRIKCLCEYNQSSLPIKDYLNNHPKKYASNHNIIKSFFDYIEKGFQHLNSYFKTLKDNLIIGINKQIKELELSYEESYLRNSSILNLLKKLAEHYDGSYRLNNFLNSSINIYNCEYSNNINEVIRYYKEYVITEEKKEFYKIIDFSIEPIKERTTNNDILYNMKEVHEIKEHTSYINSLLLLKDKTVASCSNDKTILIYNPSRDYQCIRKYQRHRSKVLSICELDDGTIVSCSEDKSICIGSHIIPNAHRNTINQVLTLPNNRIASCSEDGWIKIWKSDPPYSNIPIHAIQNNGDIRSMLYIKERDLLMAISDDYSLNLVSLSTFQYVTIMLDVYCCNANGMYLIDRDKVIVGESNKIIIIDINKCIIETEIEDLQFGIVTCFLKLRDNKTLIFGNNCGHLFKFDLNTKEYSLLKHYHKREILCLLKIDDETFLSSSFDCTIKVWKY